MADEVKAEKELVKCPCCGKLTMEPPIKVKQEALDKYIAGIVTGQPYTASYLLHNGKVSITVSNLSEVIKDKMNLLVSRTSMQGAEELNTSKQLFMIRLFTLLPVISIEIAGEPPCKKDISAVTKPLLEDSLVHYKDKEWLDKAYARLMDPAEVTGLSKTVIDKVVAKHLENYTLLTENGFDLDFSAGIVQD